ncbi:MAG: hypothetical protein RR293_03420 [Bacteroidales bacterium]
MYKLSKEDWIAVINERLDVIGIVDEEESLAHGNKYMHLEIRVIVVSNNRLCLRNILRLDGSSVIDTPFTTLLRYNETYESAFKRATEGLKNKPRFIMQYHHKTDKIDRIIRLYIGEVDNETLPNPDPDCRFWTKNQVEESLQFGTFSEFLNEEFNFLNLTIFPAIEMMTKETPDE